MAFRPMVQLFFRLLVCSLVFGHAYAATITVTLPGNVREIDAGSIVLTGAATGLPEATESSTNTSLAAITTNITTLSANALLLDIVGSGNPGSYSPGTGQTERWDASNFSATGASSTKEVAAAGASSMTQTHSSTSPRTAHAVISVAPAVTGGTVAVDSVVTDDGASVSSLSWDHILPSSEGFKLIVGIAIEEDDECPGNSNVQNVTYDGNDLTRILSEQIETANDFCMRVEFWYADVAAPDPATPTVQWRFDELQWDGTAGEVEDSIGGLDGTSFSAATVAGQVCNAGDFSATGTSDYVSVPASALDGATDFTISVWGKTSNTSNQAIFSGSDGSEHNELIMWFPNATTFEPYLKGDDLSSISIPNIADDSWHHLVWTRSGSQNCIYVDGSLSGCSTGTTDALDIASGGLIIAQEQDNLGGGFDSDQDWEGLLDEPLIFDQAISATEVTSIYNNQLAGNDWDGSARVCPSVLTPIAEWRMDQLSWDGTSGEVLDESDNSYDATAVNGADTDDVTPAIAGDPGTCRYGIFDDAGGANGDYLEISGFPNLTADFSVTAWIRTNDNSRTGQRIFADDENNSGGYAFSLGDPGTGRLRFFSRGVSPVSLDTAANVIQSDEWYFVAAVADITSGNRTIYVFDTAGSLVATPTSASFSGSWGTDSGPASIGGETNSGETGNRFFGNIDEVRVYSQVLSQTDLEGILTETHPCPEEPSTSNRVLLSTTGGATLGGLTFVDGDLVDYTPDTDTAVIFEDEDDIFEDNEDLNAVHILDTGNIVLSANENFVIDGTSFEDEDLAEYNPSTGTATLYLNGDNVFADEEDIDGVFVLASGNILLSTTGSASIGSLSFADEDIVEYNPSTGDATLYLDGSAIFSDGTDLRGIYLLDNGNVVFSVSEDDDISAGGLTFSDEDLVEYNIATDTATLFFDGTALFSGSEDIDAVHIIEAPTFVGPDHYSISHDQSAVTCLTEPITIEAQDSSDNAVDPGGVTLDLSTSTGKGDWVAVLSGTGVLTDSVAGDGAATYSMPSGETSVELSFNYTDIGVADSETVNFNVTDGSITETSGVATMVDDDPDLVVSRTGLAISSIAAQIAGKASNIAPASTITLQAVRASDSDPSVCDALFANQSVAIEFASECRNPAACAGGVSQVNGSPITVNDDNGADSTGSFTSVSVPFDASGDASLILNYDDAGLMQLHARFNIPLEDGSGALSGDFALGSSNDYVVVPAGLCVESLDADSSCAPASATCSRFRKAGESFSLSVSAVAWEASGESDSDFCTGNTITPNFELASIALTPNVIAPVGGANTVIAVPSVDIGAADNGSVSVANQSSTEVGVFSITATPPAYLGETIAASSSANIGRFYPDRFAFSDGAVTEACVPGGSGAPFTYLAQNFTASYRLTAQNTDGTTTANYRGNFVKLDSSEGSLSFGAVDVSGPVELSAPRLVEVDTLYTWNGDGTGDLVSTLVLGRESTGVIDGPFTADTGVLPSDSDAVTIALADRDLDTDNDAVDDFALIGQSRQRYGRLVVNNAFGPEELDLGVTLQAEYFNGAGFELNTDDSCTGYIGAEPPVELDNYTGDLASAGTTVTAPIVNTLLFNGRSSIFSPLLLSAPGTGNDGSVEVELDVDSWLEFDFNGDGTPENPFGVATFGQYRGNDRVIYWRERIPVQ